MDIKGFWAKAQRFCYVCVEQNNLKVALNFFISLILLNKFLPLMPYINYIST